LREIDSFDSLHRNTRSSHSLLKYNMTDFLEFLSDEEISDLLDAFISFDCGKKSQFICLHVINILFYKIIDCLNNRSGWSNNYERVA